MATKKTTKKRTAKAQGVLADVARAVGETAAKVALGLGIAEKRPEPKKKAATKKKTVVRSSGRAKKATTKSAAARSKKAKEK
jgi:hypothetical protein